MKSNNPKDDDQLNNDDKLKNLKAAERIRDFHDGITQAYAITEFSFDAHIYAGIFYCAQELSRRLRLSDPLSLSIEDLTRASAELRQIIALRQSLPLRQTAVTIGLYPDDLKKIEALAATAKLSNSDYLRDLIQEALRLEGLKAKGLI